MSHRQSLTFRNRRVEPIVVRVEPWADEMMVHPGQALNLDFEGPSGGSIEVEAEPGAFVVYGWVGSIVHVR